MPEKTLCCCKGSVPKGAGQTINREPLPNDCVFLYIFRFP